MVVVAAALLVYDELRALRRAAGDMKNAKSSSSSSNIAVFDLVVRRERERR
jgi:hypothetical protein